MKTSTMTTLQILRRGLRRVRKGWTYGTFVRDAHGKIICGRDTSIEEDCDSDRAAKWCAIGAVSTNVDAVNALANVLGEAVAHWNDSAGRTQSEVIALFKRAIKREEGRK